MTDLPIILLLTAITAVAVFFLVEFLEWLGEKLCARSKRKWQKVVDEYEAQDRDKQNT